MASAFKSTILVYIHCVSKTFPIAVKGFTCYVGNICKQRRALIPTVIANLPADKLFAGQDALC